MRTGGWGAWGLGWVEEAQGRTMGWEWISRLGTPRICLAAQCEMQEPPPHSSFPHCPCPAALPPCRGRLSP